MVPATGAFMAGYAAAGSVNPGHQRLAVMRNFGSSIRKYGPIIAALCWAQTASGARIACVGDSITFGHGLADRSTQSYPAVLAARLGASHTVQNFGVSGTTLLKNGDHPYWDEANYSASSSFDPDVVVIMLGTNDAKPQNWSHEAEFSLDYVELIEHYRSLGALVYVATPPPVYGAGGFDIQPGVVANEVVPLVRTIATDAGAPLVEVFTALSGKSELFPDTVHPNAAGAELIAETVFAAIEENGFGGMGGTGGGGAAGASGGSGAAGASGSAGAAGGSGGSSAGRAGANTGGSAAGGAPGAGEGGASNGAGTSNAGGAATSGGSPMAGSGGASAGSANAAGGAPSAGRGGASSGGGNTSLGGADGQASGGAGAEMPDGDGGIASDDGGCGCRAGREPGSWSSLWLALGVAFARVARSRMRRRDIVHGH
jgi:acyl-CoA thioesterase-1